MSAVPSVDHYRCGGCGSQRVRVIHWDEHDATLTCEHCGLDGPHVTGFTREERILRALDAYDAWLQEKQTRGERW